MPQTANDDRGGDGEEEDSAQSTERYLVGNFTLDKVNHTSDDPISRIKSTYNTICRVKTDIPPAEPPANYSAKPPVATKSQHVAITKHPVRA